MHFKYPENIRFSCGRCGLCCGDTAQRTRHVLLMESDVKRISTKLNQETSTFAVESYVDAPYIYEMKKTDEGRCLFLKNNKCEIYVSRPLICRFYPFRLHTDDEGMLEFTETNECPGISRCNQNGNKKLSEAFFKKLLDSARVEFG